ncbi:glycosyltransferase family 39 protein [Janthinobacterium sp.]|uniref:ArnT family glycosyltransferase n=1 Tax=Janthinobacterium sp. TaxID=1871054 RepID=UPI00293D999D|nr:glycosyltransferase family 39 protein [Janthinobacterium sp.]
MPRNLDLGAPADPPPRAAAGRDAAAPAPIPAVAPLGAVIAMVAIYLLPGLIGHDPWKQDETYIVAIVHHMLASGDWLVPTMAGEAFMEKPPLYYWIAALCGGALSAYLPVHDGARLATGLFMFCTCGAVAWLGRRWWGRGQGALAVLCLLACLGMLQHAHVILTDIALLAGFAVALCGVALARARPLPGGLILGTGMGMGFMAKGLFAPGVLGFTLLALTVCFRDWRRRNFLYAIGVAAVAALPWLLIWPALLYARSPTLFWDWLWLNNIGRFAGFSVPLLGAAHSKFFWLRTIPWFTFPALPLAALTLWQRRRSALSEEPCQVALMLSGAMVAVLWSAASARDNYALPLLPPLALLAAPASVRLPALVELCWRRVSLLLLGGCAALIGGVGAWMAWRGAAPDLPVLSRYLPASFVPQPRAAMLGLAAVLALATLVLARRRYWPAQRALWEWVAGLALCWALLASLCLPWLDHAKSYRGVFAGLGAVMPARHGCIASLEVGESERAMLEYFLDVRTVALASPLGRGCQLLLAEGGAAPHFAPIAPSDWCLAWRGARPGDRRESLWFFMRRQGTSGAADAPGAPYRACPG